MPWSDLLRLVLWRMCPKFAAIRYRLSLPSFSTWLSFVPNCIIFPDWKYTVGKALYSQSTELWETVKSSTCPSFQNGVVSIFMIPFRVFAFSDRQVQGYWPSPRVFEAVDTSFLRKLSTYLKHTSVERKCLVQRLVQRSHPEPSGIVIRH